LSRRRDFL
jgi:hypothetical protein